VESNFREVVNNSDDSDSFYGRYLELWLCVSDVKKCSEETSEIVEKGS